MAKNKEFVSVERLAELLGIESVEEVEAAIRKGKLVVERVKRDGAYFYDKDSITDLLNFSEFMIQKGISLRGWQAEAATAFLKIVRREQSLSGSGYAEGKTLLAEGLLEFINEHGNTFRF